MYPDDTIIYTSNKNSLEIEKTLTSEMVNSFKWLDDNKLLINLKKGKTESILFGTTKRRLTTAPLKVHYKDKLINAVETYK